MFKDKQRNRTSTSIVVLDGSKVLREKGGVEPLRYALRLGMNLDDQVIVLVVFNSGDLAQSPVITSCCIGTADGRNDHHPSERERYIRILREEISAGTERYMKIFRPFYKEFKDIGVKFVVKIVVGSKLHAIISEEKSNTGATSIVIGRSFVRESGPWTSQINCKCSPQSGDEEVVMYTCKTAYDVPESSRVQNTLSIAQSNSKFKKKSLSHDEQKLIYCVLPNFEGIYQASSSSSSMESTLESSQETESFEKFIVPKTITPSSSNELCLLVELSWEEISEITQRFSNIIPVDSNEPFKMYTGHLEDQSSSVFVKRYVGTEFRYVLEAEKKAASTMYHKNILGLHGFHKNETAMALVFPYTHMGGALMDRFLNGFWTKELKITFPVKMNIAIGIAQGLRYMHEQCPRGPIVHGNLRPCNILLGHNLQPQITGFGHAKWLQFEQSESMSRNSCGHRHPSDPNSIELIKSDILAFGILLLRLFCSRSAPRDDKRFVAWARPLIAQRAYHILYDESEYDVHGLLVVTSTAARCINTRLKSRPCMSKVLTFLKGEICCAELTFPSAESSPNMASTPNSNLWEM